MARKPILSNNEDEPFFDRLSTAIDTTLSHVNMITDLSRNFNKLKDETAFLKNELDLLESSDFIYTETAKLYEEVKNNPINADPIENRLLSLRAQLISLNENPVLVKKGLKPFIPTNINVLSDSSYLSPVSNNRSQSFKNSFNSASNHSTGSKKNTAAYETPKNVANSVKKSAAKNRSVVKAEPAKPPASVERDQQEFIPDSYDSPVRRKTHLPDKFNLAASVKKSAKKLTQKDDVDEQHNNGMNPKPLGNVDLNIEPKKNENDEASLFNRNFSNPEMNSVMARLAAWTTKDHDAEEDNDNDSPITARRERTRTRTFVLRENI